MYPAARVECREPCSPPKRSIIVCLQLLPYSSRKQLFPEERLQNWGFKNNASFSLNSPQHWIGFIEFLFNNLVDEWQEFVRYLMVRKIEKSRKRLVHYVRSSSWTTVVASWTWKAPPSSSGEERSGTKTSPKLRYITTRMHCRKQLHFTQKC